MACGLVWATLSPLKAWDAEGHRIVAEIAYELLNPQAKAELDKLALQVIGPGGPYDAIMLSVWMDDLRQKGPAFPEQGKFLSWHYISIGLNPQDSAPNFEPGQDNEMKGNVVTGLKRALVVLQGGTDPYVTSKAMACAMVLHLMGDIHQPMHAGTEFSNEFRGNGKPRNDLGGNNVKLSNGPVGDHGSNLHYFWDGAWRATFMEATGQVEFEATEGKHASHEVPKDFQTLVELRLADSKTRKSAYPPDFAAWAQESNRIAKDVAYGQLSRNEGAREANLSPDYVVAARKVARDRLVLAGLRLAELLNATLGAVASGPVPASYPAGPPL